MDDGAAVEFSISPVPPEVANGVIAVAAGAPHRMALKNDGSVVVWGDDADPNEVPPEALSGVRAIAAGEAHSLALKDDGSVIGWGWNYWGQTDIPPAARSGITAISAGAHHSLALTEDGAVIRWGRDSFVPPEAATGITAIASAFEHDLALTAEGRVLAWGTNSLGQLDVPPAALSGITAIAAQGQHSLALTAAGEVIAWGNPDHGMNHVPAAAKSGVVAIAAGYFHNLALKTDGTVVHWGGFTPGATPPPAGVGNGVLAIAGGLDNSLVIVRVAPTLTADAPPASATVGQPYAYTFTARSSPRFRVAEGDLPPGLTLDAASGVLSGTPTAAGSWEFRIGAGNGVSPDALGATHTISVDPALALVDASPPATAPHGEPYSYTFTATGAPAPTFSVVGTLPAGLTLDSVTGVLSGTPTGQGPSTFSVRASNGVQPDATSAPITLTVTRAAGLGADAPPTTLLVGTPYSYTFTATGYPAPTFAHTGDLPPGLTLDPATGVLSGTPTTSGSSTFAVTASNGIGPAAGGDQHTLVVTAPETITPRQPTPAVPIAGHPVWPAAVAPATQVPVTGRSLARTGVDHVGLLTVCGLVLVSAGTASLVALRRRRA